MSNSRRPSSVHTCTIVVVLILSAVRGACICNNHSRPAAGYPPFSARAPALQNPALDVASLSMHLLRRSKVRAHKFEMVCAAMYDTYASYSRNSSTLVNFKSRPPANISMQKQVGYAGYAALVDVLKDQPDELVLLHARMMNLGYDKPERNARVDAVLNKYALQGGKYAPTNAPSKTFDASCIDLRSPDKWKGQCIQKTPGAACVPQKAGSAAFLNASMISLDGAYDVERFVAKVPKPPRFTQQLSSLPFSVGKSSFADQYLRVLKASRQLDDKRKFIAEFVAPHAVIRANSLAINEAIARKISFEKSVLLLFAVSTAVRDAFASASEVKLRYESIRPITVIQCTYAGRSISAWNAPYYGVKEFINGKEGNTWRPYLQTSASPGYVSGTSSVAAAAASVLELFFRDKKPAASNCATRKQGMSMTEPGIEKGAGGYIVGVTDIPNSGRSTVGYSPAQDVTICWGTFNSFANILAKSREYGGIHIPKDNREGLKLGRRVAGVAFKFAMRKYRGL